MQNPKAAPEGTLARSVGVTKGTMFDAEPPRIGDTDQRLEEQWEATG